MRRSETARRALPALVVLCTAPASQACSADALTGATLRPKLCQPGHKSQETNK